MCDICHHAHTGAVSCNEAAAIRNTPARRASRWAVGLCVLALVIGWAHHENTTRPPYHGPITSSDMDAIEQEYRDDQVENGYRN